MTRKLDRKAAQYTEQFSSEFQTELTRIQGDSFDDINRKWLGRYCRNVKKNTGHWIYNKYRWHAYTFNHHSALEGERAFDAYVSRKMEPFCLFFEFDNLLFACVATTWPDVRPMQNDIYVFPHRMTWTFITTHESSMDIGPFFARPPEA